MCVCVLVCVCVVCVCVVCVCVVLCCVVLCCAALRCGAAGCGVVWCGVVWCGVVWCGVVWCGVVCVCVCVSFCVCVCACACVVCVCVLCVCVLCVCVCCVCVVCVCVYFVDQFYCLREGKQQEHHLFPAGSQQIMMTPMKFGGHHAGGECCPSTNVRGPGPFKRNVVQTTPRNVERFHVNLAGSQQGMKERPPTNHGSLRFPLRESPGSFPHSLPLACPLERLGLRAQARLHGHRGVWELHLLPHTDGAMLVEEDAGCVKLVNLQL